MPQTEASIEGLPLANRENAGGGGNPSVAHDHSAIMQSGFRVKERQEEFDGKNRIDNDASLFVNADGGIAFNRDERAELLVRQLGYRFREIVDGLALLARQGENRMAPQFGQAAPQFGLENHHKGDGQEDGKAADDPADDHEVQQLRDQGQGQENDRQAGKNFRSARPSKVEIAIINPHTQQDDLNETSPFSDPELNDLLAHITTSRRRSVARKAAAFCLTSCTRNTFAPRSRNSAVNAIVGARRSFMSVDPIIWPRDDLRETPTTIGRS